MRIYTLRRKQILSVSVEIAWNFFSSPENLEKITLSYLRFKILSDIKQHPLHDGMLIEYKVSPILGIPLEWITKISEVNAPFSFKDIQLKGPYKLWEHTHTFKEVQGGVEMTDEVKYALPLGMLGRLAHVLFLKKQIEGIFNYRKEVLVKLFR